jgi:hypothetical protein
MPGEQNDGFAYLDASREAYTDEKADESINIVPTEAQLTRINRMYPQYRRHLRDTGFSEMEQVDEAYDVVYEIDFTKETDINKFEPSRLVDVSIDSEKGLVFTSNHSDSYFFVKFEDGLNLKYIVAIRLTADIPAAVSSEMFFVTKQSGNWEQKKSVQLHTSVTGSKESHIIKLKKDVWLGDMTSLRVDLLNQADQTGSVKKIEFLVFAVMGKFNFCFGVIFIEACFVKPGIKANIDRAGAVVCFHPHIKGS